MLKNKTIINLTANIIAFCVTLSISFFLSPFLVKTVGPESYGFVSLSNSFVNYMALITIALNSMAGRYVTIKFHQNDIASANKYFNSVMFSNIAIASLLIIPSTILVLKLNSIIAVPLVLLKDIQILFLFIFSNFLLSSIFSIFTIAYFVKNSLYLSSFRSIETSIIKSFLLILLYKMFPTKIYYIGFVSVIVTLYSGFWSVYYTKRLLVELKISVKYFDIKVVLELLRSGIWNVVSKLGNVLLEGVDLLLANLFISPLAMGTLAIAKTVPNMIILFIMTIASVFTPNITIAYAKENFNEIKNTLKQSIKLLGIFANVPFVILFVFGDIFYKLWMPNQNSLELQILSILTILVYIVSGSVCTVYDGFAIANKLKLQSLIIVGSGICNIIIVFILLNLTNLGVYAIAGVSSLIAITRDLLFSLPMATKHLKQKWNTFYPSLFMNLSVLTISTLLIYPIRLIFTIDNWYTLTFSAIISSLFCICLNLLVITTKNERGKIINIILRKSEF